MIGRLVPGKGGVEDHGQEQVVAVVDHDDLPARPFQGGMVDEVLLGAVCPDVALERELARHDFLDRDLLFPAIPAVAFLTPGFGHLGRAAQGALGLRRVRFSRHTTSIGDGELRAPPGVGRRAPGVGRAPASHGPGPRPWSAEASYVPEAVRARALTVRRRYP